MSFRLPKSIPPHLPDDLRDREAVELDRPKVTLESLQEQRPQTLAAFLAGFTNPKRLDRRAVLAQVCCRTGRAPRLLAPCLTSRLLVVAPQVKLYHYNPCE